MDRRGYAAVYAVCANIADVDEAFRKILSLAYTEDRERYVWGVLLDLSPSLIFRACGDAAIEERVRRCYSELEAKLPTCDCFALLRGRRYGVDRVYRCENGLFGALAALSRLGCRSEDGWGEFTLSLGIFSPEGDVWRCGERIFVLQTDGYMKNAPPGTLERASELDGTVAMVPCRMGSVGRKLQRRGKTRRKPHVTTERLYRGDGWFIPGVEVADGDIRLFLYDAFVNSRADTRSSARGYFGYTVPSFGAERTAGDSLFRCVEACLCSAFGFDMREGEAKRRISGLWLGADECRCTAIGELMLSATAIYELGRFETLTLCDIYDALCAEAEYCLVLGNEMSSPAFLRFALLICAAEAERLGVDTGVMYLVSGRLARIAELLRRRYESGAHRTRGDGGFHMKVTERTGGGLKSGADAVYLHYLALCAECVPLARKRELLLTLCGGENMLTSDGIARGGRCWLRDNSLAVCAAAEIKNRTFSRGIAASGELSAHLSALWSFRGAYEPTRVREELSVQTLGRMSVRGTEAVKLNGRFELCFEALRYSVAAAECFAAIGARADMLPFVAFFQSIMRRIEAKDAADHRYRVCIETEKMSYPLVKRLMEGATLYGDIERRCCDIFGAPSGKYRGGAFRLTVLTGDGYGASDISDALGRGCEICLISEELGRRAYRENSAFYRVINVETALSDLL